MFTWNDDASEDTKEAISAGLNELTKLDVVTAYHHGPDAGIGSGNWDYVAVGDFASAADYQVYASDPGHIALIADLIKPNIRARAAVQYEF